jgi:hypothetical protein
MKHGTANTDSTIENLTALLDSARMGDLTGEVLVGEVLKSLHELGVDLPPPIASAESVQDGPGQWRITPSGPMFTLVARDRPSGER